MLKYESLLEKSVDYYTNWLNTITAVLAGESYDALEYKMGSYFAGFFPNGVWEGVWVVPGLRRAVMVASITM